MRKILALADCNNFFVSCEILKTPSLKGKAVCVLSNCDGCVVSRSNEAKKIGIKMGMPLFMAKKEFPDAIYLSSDLSFYHKISMRVMKILKDFSPSIEICSIDEAFLDVTDLCKIYNVENYEKLAKFLHEKILNELGIPVSIGISTSKILCKIAVSKAKKRNCYYFLPFENISEEIFNIRVEDIWSIGKNTASLLKAHGLYTAGDILKRDKEFFSHYMGKRGLELKFGLEGQNVLPINDKDEKPKSIQKTSSFINFTNDKDYLKNSILEHLHNACKKMRKYNLVANEITVMLRSKDFRVITLSDVISPTNAEYILNKKVIELFEKIYSNNVLYRSTGVYLSGLKDSEVKQLQLLNCSEKYDKISKIWDSIEEKHGKGIFQDW